MVKGLRVNATFGPTVWHVTSNSITKDKKFSKTRAITDYRALITRSKL